MKELKNTSDAAEEFGKSEFEKFSKSSTFKRDPEISDKDGGKTEERSRKRIILWDEWLCSAKKSGSH